jgi:hypothetical protein
MGTTLMTQTDKPVESAATPVWMKRVPMITGVLAGLAGFLTVRSANNSNLINYHSILAVLNQSKSSDAWAEYQADSLKRHMDETALAATVSDPSAKSKLEGQIRDYKDRQEKAKLEATEKANLRDAELQNGQEKLDQKNLLDYAGVCAQLGIALASVAALTRRQLAFNVSLVIGVLALIITGYALAFPFVLRFIHHH